jgi:hypothetical protein
MLIRADGAKLGFRHNPRFESRLAGIVSCQFGAM